MRAPSSHTYVWLSVGFEMASTFQTRFARICGCCVYMCECWRHHSFTSMRWFPFNTPSLRRMPFILYMCFSRVLWCYHCCLCLLVHGCDVTKPNTHTYLLILGHPTESLLYIYASDLNARTKLTHRQEDACIRWDSRSEHIMCRWFWWMRFRGVRF